MAVSPDSKTVYVTGNTRTGLNLSGFGTVAYDATTGAQLWASLYNPPDASASATAINLSPDGKTVFVTGSSEGSGPAQGATVAYDAATGAQIWADSGVSALEVATSQAISPDGSTVFDTGYEYGGGTWHLDTVAYASATGVKLWEIEGPAGRAFSIALSPDGTRVFVTGFAQARANKYLTIAYDTATGARLWGSRYTAPSGFGSIAFAVAVSPSGLRLYVTGVSVGSATSESDYATVAYAADDGAQLWASRYNGPGNGPDTAIAVAVSPAGRAVFVTGYSTGIVSGYDWATIDYRT